jgi:hypothetical protein
LAKRSFTLAGERHEEGRPISLARRLGLANLVGERHNLPMVAVDQEWWEHLTPPAMHARRAEMDAVLSRFVATAYGAFWLRSATTPHGVIRVSPGQPIPVLHALALGDKLAFPLPQRQVRLGHRFVGSHQMASGRSLAPGELALGPEIRFEVVKDPVILSAIARAVATLDIDRPFVGVTRPTQIFSIPARYLLAPEHSPRKSYVLYQHIFGHSGSYPDDGYFYVGITTRSWQKRWAEHRRAIAAGSSLRFHRVFRDETKAQRITYVHHKVMGVTDNVEVLYNTEKWLLEQHWHDERRLNMIPGGKAGRHCGVASDGAATKIENVRARSDRLSVDQVQTIRTLRDTLSVAEIAKRVGAGTARQVRGVVAGRTYRSVYENRFRTP